MRRGRVIEMADLDWEKEHGGTQRLGPSLTFFITGADFSRSLSRATSGTSKNQIAPSSAHHRSRE